MVVAADVREWGTQSREKKSAEYLAMGYVPLFMKDDFARICPESIPTVSGTGSVGRALVST